MGYSPDRILILENGQIALFENKILKSVAQRLELEDTMIDGKENWDVTGVVLKDREVLSTDGVMIIGVGVNHKTKEISNGPDVYKRQVVKTDSSINPSTYPGYCPSNTLTFTVGEVNESAK